MWIKPSECLPDDGQRVIVKLREREIDNAEDMGDYGVAIYDVKTT